MMLYLKGTIDLNARRILSIVGTRNSTEYGRGMTQQIVRDLSDSNIIIVSGLAFGIDSIAHRCCLENSIPTLGVLAHGLDQIYPKAHRSLASKMLKNGGLLTEFVSFTEMDPSYFPRRNRIVAGISDAVIVIESAVKGGALITADIALSYNRDVLAVPGRAGDPLSAGCNYLIKSNKAALVESAKDILDIMRWNEEKKPGVPQKQLFISLTTDEEAIVKLMLEHGECGIDFICLHSRLNTGKVANILLNLEFNGIIRGLPGKRYSLL
jgi:DNA processing protein